jgi:outer membrane protein assembly factor BamA
VLTTNSGIPPFEPCGLEFCSVLPRLSIIVTVLLSLSCALAQAPKSSPNGLPPTAFKLKSVQVIGTSRYKPEEVVRAGDLEIGQSFHDDDLKTVVRLLGESGAFSAVSYSSQFEPDGAKVKLKLRDADRFFPTHFDNVVWFTDRELVEKLHAKLPLFNGELPANGSLANDVSDALQLLLMAKNVAGQVEYLRPLEEDNPFEAFVFTVRGPNITIRNVGFSGAGPAELPALTSAAKKMEGVEYRRPAIRAIEDKMFPSIYREHGYLKAVFGDPQATVVQSDAQGVLVDIVVPINPGHQYRLAGVQFSGNQAFPDSTLRAAFRVQDGEIANLRELEKDLEAVHHICGTRGYVNASIKADTRLDDARFTVLYLVSIAEGDVYKMGEVEIRGLDSHTTARLESDWTLHSGDTYDASYVGRFLEQAYKVIGDWHATVQESVDPQAKTVDVRVRFDSTSDSSAF